MGSTFFSSRGGGTEKRLHRHTVQALRARVGIGRLGGKEARSGWAKGVVRTFWAESYECFVYVLRMVLETDGRKGRVFIAGARRGGVGGVGSI